MNPHRQAIALGVHTIDRAVQLATLPGGDMDDRAEPFLVQIVHRIEMDQRGRHEQPLVLARHRAAVDHILVPGFAIGVELVIARLVDHRADIGIRLMRIADHQRIHRALQHLDRAIIDLFLDQQQPHGRTALASRLEAGNDHIAHHLLGQRGGIHDHGVDAAGFRDQRDQRAVVLGHQAARDDLGRRVAASEGDARDAPVIGQRRAGLRAADGQLQRAARHAGLTGKANGQRSDLRRLRRGLGHHRIARHQRGGHLPHENRQREVPRRNAGPDSPALHAQDILLPRRPRQFDGLQLLARLRGIIAAEIHRLAHIAQRIGNSLLRFLDQHRHQLFAALLHQIGEFLQTGSALVDRGHRPVAERPVAIVDTFIDILLAAQRHGDRLAQTLGQALQILAVFQIQPDAVLALGHEQVLRQRDAGVARTAYGLDLVHRVRQQLILIHVAGGELMHKARIGAIFQQSPDEIGQQIGMAANRRIGAHAIALVARHALVQSLAHAVQALEFVPVLGQAGLGRPVQQRGDGQRIMGRESGHQMAAADHLARAGQIADIGGDLAGKQREIAESHFLRMLDLGVPIGTLDQPRVDLAAGLRAKRIGPFHDREAALGIGLDGHAETVPSFQRGMARDIANDVQADHQPLGFLGIDGQRHAGFAAPQRQIEHHLGNDRDADARACRLIARMQRGELDRDAVSIARSARHIGGMAIGFEIAIGIVHRARRLAQHVEAGDEAAILALVHAPDGFFDIAAHDEHFAHQFHRLANGTADERLAAARHQSAQHIGLRRCADHGLAEHQTPGGAVDHLVGGRTGMRAPIRAAHLVRYQAIRRIGVGHAQKRFGQRQQRRAFFRAETIFLQELVDPALGLARPQIDQQTLRLGQDQRPFVRPCLGLHDEGSEHFRLGFAMKVAQLTAQVVTRDHETP